MFKRPSSSCHDPPLNSKQWPLNGLKGPYELRDQFNLIVQLTQMNIDEETAEASGRTTG